MFIVIILEDQDFPSEPVLEPEALIKFYYIDKNKFDIARDIISRNINDLDNSIFTFDNQNYLFEKIYHENLIYSDRVLLNMEIMDLELDKEIMKL